MWVRNRRAAPAAAGIEPAPDARAVPRMRRLSTRLALSHVALLVLVVGLTFWVYIGLAQREVNGQYEHRALAVAQAVAGMPETIASLTGAGPVSAVQPLALRITHSIGAAFVVVVDRRGIRLSSPDPALVGKWFHERVVALDGRVHLRIDPGKPNPTANARAPVFGPGRRVVGEVSVGFLQRDVSATVAHELPAIGLVTGLALVIGVLGSLLLARRLKRVTLGMELEQITELLHQREQLANEQSALHHVAALVAQGRPQDEIFAAVAEQVSAISQADTVQILRYEPDGTAVRVAAWGRWSERLEIGRRYPLGGHNLATLVHETARPASIDDTSEVGGAAAAIAHELGAIWLIGGPIIVDGGLWGLVAASSSTAEPTVTDSQSRIAAFTELAATAISNAQAHEELAASRRRVVAAADDMRRRIERDLHDSTQQRLVSLGIRLRLLQQNTSSPSELRNQLSQLSDDVDTALEEVRELSRGVHPAVLSHGGLPVALASLARRSPVPMELDVSLPDRLPEVAEVTAYYVVTEALTNATKHAHAGKVEVKAEVCEGTLQLRVTDDGIGGADPARGTGIIGLRDRVEAHAGRMWVVSPPGQGTSIQIELPISTDELVSAGRHRM